YSLKSGKKIKLHHGTREIMGRASLFGLKEVKQGEDGFARFKLDYPLIVRNYDRFIIRNPSSLRTMGGGLILRSRPPRKRLKREETINQLNILNSCDKKEIISFWIRES
ncbi:unnamed protein product, partial [marine sediment metagenome]